MARRNWAKGNGVSNIEVQAIDPITLNAVGAPGFLQGKWRELSRSGKIMQEDATPTDSLDTDRVDTQVDWSVQIAEMMTNGYGSNVIDNFWDSTAGGNNDGGVYQSPTVAVSIREFGEKRVYIGMAETCDSQRVRGVNSVVLTVNKIATGFPNPAVGPDPGS